MKKLHSIMHKTVLRLKSKISCLSFWVLSFLFLTACATFPEKEPAMAFTITVPGGAVQLSGNPIRIIGTTTTQGVTDHRLLCKVTCTDGAIPGGPWTDSIAPLNGSATFDISGLVDTVFDYSFDINYTNIVNEHEKLAANIEIEIGEEYIDGNGDLQTVWDTADPYEMIVLKGELELPELTTLAQNGSSFYNKYIVGEKFLRNKLNSTNHEITVSSISDNVKVWIYRFADFTTLNSCRVFFESGAYTTEYFDLPAFASSKLYEVNIEVKAISINEGSLGLFGKPVKYVASFGKDSFIVNIDNRYYENHDELLILNRFGAVEDLHCYGEATTSVGTGGETYSKPLPESPTVFDATLFTEGKDGKQVYKINTGFKTKQERLWIKDLLLYKKKQAWLKSEKLPWLTGKTFGICPVIITTTSVDVDTTGEDVKSIELEIQLAH